MLALTAADDERMTPIGLPRRSQAEIHASPRARMIANLGVAVGVAIVAVTLYISGHSQSMTMPHPRFVAPALAGGVEAPDVLAHQ